MLPFALGTLLTLAVLVALSPDPGASAENSMAVSTVCALLLCAVSLIGGHAWMRGRALTASDTGPAIVAGAVSTSLWLLLQLVLLPLLDACARDVMDAAVPWHVARALPFVAVALSGVVLAFAAGAGTTTLLQLRTAR